MPYALVIDGQVQSEGLPRSARRLDTQEWVMPPGGLRNAPQELREACGYFEVVDAPRPDDTPTTTHDRTLAVVAGAPTVVWVERPKTADEITQATVTVNETTLTDKLRQALEANTAFLDLTTPTNAQILTHLRRITRETNALMRFQLRDLDDISDT